jgi:hypothetical protein
MYDTTQQWMDAHGLLDLEGTASRTASRYANVVLT